MVYGDLQFFDIIIFAVIAVFIIYRLRSVLGKRTGFQKNINQQEFVKKETTPDELTCLLYTSPSPRDVEESRMPSSA